MSEIELHQSHSSLRDQMDFARTVVVRPEGGAASLLPQAYRDNPANVLLAVGLGSGMGLSPAESLYRIDVIQGKPCASAELIASNVRKAGHKLRVKVSENPPSATCTIIRADDPDEPTTISRDMQWAKDMGLHTKDNYRKQPSTMLAWRAISAAARLACPEALYGVSYTPDEIWDVDDRPVRPASGLGAALGQTTITAEHIPPTSDPAEPLDEAIPSAPPETPEAAGSDSPDGVTAAQLKKIGASMRDLGITDRANALVYVADVIGREVTSRNELTKDEAGRVIDSLERDMEQPFPAEEPSA